MKNSKSDKTKRKNWVEGDAFALKVENTETKYDGKYIILIKSEQRDGYKETPCRKYFRAKITQTDNIPDNKEKIEKLEFIKFGCISMSMRFFPINALKSTDEQIKEKSKVKVYPDEYGYLYTYIFDILFDRNTDISDMKYIGNYKIDTPKTEFFPFDYMNVQGSYYPFLIEKLIKHYKEYNLKESDIYDKDATIGVHKMANNFLNTAISINKQIRQEK